MKLILLTQGKFAQVDDWNYDWLMQWKWFALKCKNSFYAGRMGKPNEITKKRKIVLMHRIIMNTPNDQIVDHKDWNGLNCQEHNMRNCTHSQNHANKKKENKSSSKHKGVTWDKNKGKWAAAIKTKGIRKHLGYFDSENRAALAYNQAAKELFGEFVVLNKVLRKVK